MKRLRIYADTSVFGGCFDREFAESSRRFFDAVHEGKFILVISDATSIELEDAPPEVKAILNEIPRQQLEKVQLSGEVETLRDAYLKAGIVGPSSTYDAEHIACASVAHVDLIVSWNFRHIVNFEKIRGYHGINLINGYPPVPIYSPREVISS